MAFPKGQTNTKLITHGDATAKGDHHLLYRTHRNMLNKCGHTGSNTPDKKYYAERGIIVCAEWFDYEAFKQWALSNGYAIGLTIDRINNDGNYEPENCRWVTRKEQASNRRTTAHITHKGQTRTLSEWAQLLGMHQSSLRERIKRWGVEKALTTPRATDRPVSKYVK